VYQEAMADFIECLGEVHNENISLFTIIQVSSHVVVNPNKEAGPDEIKPRVLKDLATEIAPILTIIFQTSLESGVVPSEQFTVKFKFTFDYFVNI
jgi:hypothetical protein